MRLCMSMQLSRQEFVKAPVPKKWGREQERAQEKSGQQVRIGRFPHEFAVCLSECLSIL